MNENLVQDFSNQAKEAGLRVVDMPPVSSGLNKKVVFAVAAGVTVLCVGVVLGVPKAVSGIKNHFKNKKLKVDKEALEKKAELVDDENPDEDEE